MNQVMISVKDKSSYSELWIIKYKKLIPIINYFDALQHTPIPPRQNPQTYPLYNLDKYCKISVIGGLAQLVEQRTHKPALTPVNKTLNVPD